MRISFWLATVVGIVLAVLGWFGFDLNNVFQDVDVVGEVIGQWYLSQIIYSAIVGVSVGIVSAVLASTRLRHRPREHGRQFNSRVAGWGLTSVLVALFLTAVIAGILAARDTSFPVRPIDRVLELLTAGRMFTVVGVNAFLTMVAFSLTSRALNWGGQYAILGRGWKPQI